MWGNFFILWLLFISCIFWPPGVKMWNFWTYFSHFGGLPYWNGKKWIKWKRCASSIPIWSVASVFSFSVRKCLKISKNMYFGHFGGLPDWKGKKIIFFHMVISWLNSISCFLHMGISWLRKNIIPFPHSPELSWCSDFGEWTPIKLN